MSEQRPGPTPPPERPLSDQARARIRAELLDQAQDNRSRVPRWLVPAGAAAAVALVAGLGFWAVNAGSSDGQSLPVGGGGTTGAHATAATPVAPQKTPSNIPETASTTTPEPTVTVGTGSCADELVNVLEGAEPVLQLDDRSAFYVKGDQFVLCDTIGGRTTIHKPLPLSPRLDAETYAVSSSYAPAQGGGYQVTRVAGGVVPDGVTDFDAIYEFPDGHVQHSQVVTDDQGRSWWLMVHSYHEASGVNETKLPRIRVAVVQDTEQDNLSLQWGVDTCAQANHGC